MSFELSITEHFERHAKRLLKKYPSLKGELLALYDSLLEAPKQGEDLGKGCFKIRLAIKSKGKGKRGGARVITHVHITKTTVYLLDIYDKSEKETVSEKEVEALLELVK